MTVWRWEEFSRSSNFPRHWHCFN